MIGAVLSPSPELSTIVLRTGLREAPTRSDSVLGDKVVRICLPHQVYFLLPILRKKGFCMRDSRARRLSVPGRMRCYTRRILFVHIVKCVPYKNDVASRGKSKRVHRGCLRARLYF